MNKKTHWLLKITALIGLSLAGTAAHAIPTGTYELGNHPGGNAQDPLYGFRLDGLLTGNQSDIYTFNFEENGASMFMTYDGSSVHIFGQAWGGLDTGTSYGGSGDNAPRLWDIDFTYDVGLVDLGDGLGVMAWMANTGTISSDLGTWDLYDYHNAGDEGFSFFLDYDHRGHHGISGWGWVNHCLQVDEGEQQPVDCGTHMYASDWLFTAHIVPEPATLFLFAIGLAAIGFRRRRNLA